LNGYKTVLIENQTKIIKPVGTFDIKRYPRAAIRNGLPIMGFSGKGKLPDNQNPDKAILYRELT
jgi:hypothetical protein